MDVNEKTKDKSEHVNILSLTIPPIKSLLVTIQKLQRDIIAMLIDVEKLTNLPKYGAQDPYLKSDGNIADPPNGTLLSCCEVKKIHSEIEHDNVTLGRLRER